MAEQKVNYQLLTDGIIKKHREKQEIPTLLLHCCCAPCSSYVLEYLSEYFSITAYYYNPNISPEEEYELRYRELARLTEEMKFKNPVKVRKGPYEPERFLEKAKGLEEEREGGSRCGRCFSLRLSKTAELAAKEGFDYFTTTLTISPLKNAMVLNETGYRLAERYGVSWLPSDFKKRGGYLRSIELSREHGLYRQNYCGCGFSKRQREEAEPASEKMSRIPKAQDSGTNAEKGRGTE